MHSWRVVGPYRKGNEHIYRIQTARKESALTLQKR